MALTKENKKAIVDKYKLSDSDTGSVEVQVAILTEEINKLGKHMQENKHDYRSNRGLIKKVNKRRNLLKYLKEKDFDRYQKLIKSLNLRK